MKSKSRPASGQKKKRQLDSSVSVSNSNGGENLPVVTNESSKNDFNIEIRVPQASYKIKCKKLNSLN